MRRVFKLFALVLIPAGLMALGIASYMHRSSASDESFQTVPLKRGDLVETISSTGTVEPEEVVDVGAQVAGKILAFGKDKKGKPIDYGSVVEAGTVLARIDDSLYDADMTQAKASLIQAEANEQRAEADLGQFNAKLVQAERDWDRAKKLGPSDALAQSAYDAYNAAYESAKSNLAVGEATVAQNKGAVLQAKAALDRAQQNLGYCTVISPVKGVIIDRRVNIGQTVVASLNAPSLFLIAKDLSRMQVWVSVNEADIGRIHAGEPVTFTVDARPGKTFAGKVGKIRLNATMTQNVVNYTVEVVTDNSNGDLLPYLTANVQFQVARHENVLMAPNAALHWTPKPQDVAPDSADPATRPEAPAGGHFSTLWVKAENGLEPVRVRTGLSNGTMTEVQGDGLSEGLEVVIGEQRPDTHGTDAATSNPFAPHIGRGGRGSR